MTRMGRHDYAMMLQVSQCISVDVFVCLDVCVVCMRACVFHSFLTLFIFDALFDSQSTYIIIITMYIMKSKAIMPDSRPTSKN